jgi:peptidoglycan/xylan/chitin deacetylase (PgdA/CDA1 family)
MLEKIYEEIFKMHIPTNLSIIPYVRTDIKIKNNPYSKFDGVEYEPFVPREFHNKKQHFAVYENRELIEFIKNAKEHVELIQHGFSHCPHEFLSMNMNVLEKKIISGGEIFKRAFDAPPKFFSAPYDVYSSVSLSIVKNYFMGATYGAFKLKSMFNLRHGINLPLRMVPSYLNALRRGDNFFLNDGFLLLGYNYIPINTFREPDLIKFAFEKCAENHKVVVITQHYWELFYIKREGIVGDNLNKELFNTLLEIIRWLKSQGVKFLTISEFYKKIQ